MDKLLLANGPVTFSFRSFRASIGNGFRFILGNLFFFVFDLSIDSLSDFALADVYSMIGKRIA